MPEPYSTAVYPYPTAMWDEAAEILAAERTWATVLLNCPDPVATRTTAVEELNARGLAVHALVSPVFKSQRYIIRVSLLKHVDPRWDEVEDHLRNHANVALIVVDNHTDDANAMFAVAKEAMFERGLSSVGVGFAGDDASLKGLLRIEVF